MKSIRELPENFVITKIFSVTKVFSLVPALSVTPKFGPKQNSKMPFDHHHHPPQQTFERVLGLVGGSKELFHVLTY